MAPLVRKVTRAHKGRLVWRDHPEVRADQDHKVDLGVQEKRESW